ncbi:MAG: sugar ABC transporter permease [Clostridia bacterium]|nr:sugar ABC transporter permease [Clostridia bacterium]
MSYKMQQKVILAAFLTVPVLLLIMFLVYPTLRLFYMSFTDWDGAMPTKNFVGMDNYVTVFTTPEVWLSLRNNLYYIANGILQNIIALFFAIILDSKLKGKNFFKATIFVTYVINSAAVGYMFNYVYDFEKGPLNIFLTMMGVEPIPFLTHPIIVNVSIACVSLWRYTGYTMVLYLAALQSVPSELYESAMVDGASAWQRFTNITIPSIIRVVELNLFLCLSGGLQAFTEAFIMTKGGPGYDSSTFLTYIIKAAFEFNSFGLSAALSFALLILILVVTYIQRKVVLRGGGDEGDALYKA